MTYTFDDDYADVPDEYYEEKHRRTMNARLAREEYGSPDYYELADALEETDEENEECDD